MRPSHSSSLCPRRGFDSGEVTTVSPTVPTHLLVAGKYRLVRQIGGGGMGSVWQAQHVSLGTPVAIKFIDADPGHASAAAARFQTEAHAAASLRSKHAIKVFDHGALADGRAYLVMEMLVGESLETRLQRVGRLSLREAAHLIQQIARALSEAHDKGIAHRDLKPDNIFLVRDDDEGTVVAKLLDFGIAKVRGAAAHTKMGALLGTPAFMSPEQACGLTTVDGRSDLWSLGVIVFRCVTGALPFGGSKLGERLLNICSAPVPLPSVVRPGLPREFDEWMARALQRDPAQRFQSASELSAALAVIAGVSVAPPSWASLPSDAEWSEHTEIMVTKPAPPAFRTVPSSEESTPRTSSGWPIPESSESRFPTIASEPTAVTVRPELARARSRMNAEGFLALLVVVGLAVGLITGVTPSSTRVVLRELPFASR